MTKKTTSYDFGDFGNLNDLDITKFHDAKNDQLKQGAFHPATPEVQAPQQPAFQIPLRDRNIKMTFSVPETMIAIFKLFAQQNNMTFSQALAISIQSFMEQQGLDVESITKSTIGYFQLETELRKWFKMRPSKFMLEENFVLRDDYFSSTFMKSVGCKNPREVYRKAVDIRDQLRMLPAHLDLQTSNQLGTDLSNERNLLIAQAERLVTKIEEQYGEN